MLIRKASGPKSLSTHSTVNGANDNDLNRSRQSRVVDITNSHPKATRKMSAHSFAAENQSNGEQNERENQGAAVAQ